MMKKRVVALTTAAVMALSMTACGGGGGADKTASGDKEGGLSGEITVWSWDVALAHLEEWAEKFQEENPDVTFNFEEMGVDQVYQKMTTCCSPASAFRILFLLRVNRWQSSERNFLENLKILQI